MKRIDLIIPHERFHEVSGLRNHKVGGLTCYDVKGRGRVKNEPVAIGRVGPLHEVYSKIRISTEVLVPDPAAKSIIIDDVLKAELPGETIR